MLISRFHPLWHLILVFETEANTYNLNYLNAIPCLKPDETGFMFDCCSVRFSNIRLCSIGKILWLCSNVKILGWVWLSSIPETNRSKSNDWSSITDLSIGYTLSKRCLSREKNWYECRDRSSKPWPCIGHAQLKTWPTLIFTL